LCNQIISSCVSNICLKIVKCKSNLDCKEGMFCKDKSVCVPKQCAVDSDCKEVFFIPLLENSLMNNRLKTNLNKRDLSAFNPSVKKSCVSKIKIVARISFVGLENVPQRNVGMKENFIFQKTTSFCVNFLAGKTKIACLAWNVQREKDALQVAIWMKIALRYKVFKFVLKIIGYRLDSSNDLSHNRCFPYDGLPNSQFAYCHFA